MYIASLSAFISDILEIRELVIGIRNGQYEVNFSFFVEFMPKKVYHVENSYSKDVLKAF